MRVSTITKLYNFEFFNCMNNEFWKFLNYSVGIWKEILLITPKEFSEKVKKK